MPIYAVNMLLSTATDMWALRYPEPTSSTSWTGRRRRRDPEFDMRTKRIHARSEHLCTRPSVVFATERMDDDPRWSLLAPGELVHVDAALRITRDLVLPDPPRHLLRREDLSAPVAARATHAVTPNVTTRRALVLAGGGMAGIAWETGILRGIADESPAAARLLLDSDVLVGTSAGSAVAAQISSGARSRSCSIGKSPRRRPRSIPASTSRPSPNCSWPPWANPTTSGDTNARADAADRRGGAGDRDRPRARPPRGDRAAPAVARVAGAGAAAHRDRHRHRRTRCLRSGLGCGARRRGGGQLCGARGLAAGDDRGPALHGRWGCQLGQPRRCPRL